MNSISISETTPEIEINGNKKGTCNQHERLVWLRIGTGGELL
jgi:hypothetical protein